MKTFTLLLILCTACTEAACAQIGVRRGTPQNCHGVITAALAGGNEGAVPACAPEVTREVAAVLERSASETDVRRLTLLAWYAGKMRDGAIFKAAVELMTNPTATDAARSAAMLIALSQDRLGMRPSTWDAEGKALTEPLPVDCYLLVPVGGQYWTENPLPTGYRQELSVSLSSVLADQSAPPMVRSLANCTRRHYLLDRRPRP